MVTDKKRAEGKRRGQQMGFAGQPDRNRVEIEETPALRGERKVANKMFGDVSDQQTSSNVVSPSTNSPSTPAMKESHPDSGGEAVFKHRLAKKRGKK